MLFAPGYDEQALEALARKPSMRILEDTERRALTDAEPDYRRVLGGLLVQERDWDIEEREGMEVVCGEVSDEQWGDLLFAWRVVQARHLERDRARAADGRRSGSARGR